MEYIETSRKEKQNSSRKKNSIIMGREKDTKVSDKVTNTQPDTITHSKIQTDI